MDTEHDSAQALPITRRMNRFRMRRGLLIRLLALVLLLVVVACAYFAYNYYKLKNDPLVVQKTKTEQTLKALSKLMVVPNDPNVVMATITDKSKLDNQAFFTRAENGDQVVVFPSIREIVLYRPQLGRIIDIAPLAATTQPPAAAISTAPTPSEETKTPATSTPKKTATSTSTKSTP